MPTVSTCLWFDSQALEAAQYYCSLVPDGRITSVMEDPGGNPHTRPGQVLYVEFELGGQRFGALNGGPHFRLDEAASVVLTCRTQEEADAFWDRFVADGAPSMCGWLTDKFGLSWQIVPERVNELQAAGSPGSARRAVQAMMGMRRLDSAVMERVATASVSDVSDVSATPGTPAGPSETRMERIERAVRIDASPAAVWALASEPGWWVNEGSLREHVIRSDQGRHEVTDPAYGTFVVSDAGSDDGEYIAFRWDQSSEAMHDDSGLHTLTQFWVIPDGDATVVRVIESGFLDAGLEPARLREIHEANAAGWDIELTALKQAAERR